MVQAKSIVANGATQVTVDDSLTVTANLAVADAITNDGAAVLTGSSGYAKTAANAKFATLTGAEVLTNRTLVDANLVTQDEADATKKAKLDEILQVL